MICPECGGAGRIRKRFLIFFRRWASCRTCRGTGEFPPPAVQRPYSRVRDDDDDDRDTWAARGYGAGTAVWSGRDSPAEDSRERFDVGSGGRSGGGGAEASWGDAGDNAPVIVDPFAAASGAASSAIAAEAADMSSADSSAGSGSSNSGDTAESSDSGTSY